MIFIKKNEADACNDSALLYSNVSYKRYKHNHWKKSTVCENFCETLTKLCERIELVSDKYDDIEIKHKPKYSFVYVKLWYNDQLVLEYHIDKEHLSHLSKGQVLYLFELAEVIYTVDEIIPLIGTEHACPYQFAEDNKIPLIG
tara:strand:- start:69 stop:497 length:429 start_codon:yes stop_codon:yes gene_type:complete